MKDTIEIFLPQDDNAHKASKVYAKHCISFASAFSENDLKFTGRSVDVNWHQQNMATRIRSNYFTKWSQNNMETQARKRGDADKIAEAADLENTYLLKERKTTKLNTDDGEPTDRTGSRWQQFMASRPMLVEPAYFIFSIADRSSAIAHTQFVTALIEESTLEAENLTEATGEVEDDIQSEASIWLLYCNLARALPAIFVTLIVVAYGDVGGRRPGLLLSNVGSFARHMMYVIVIYEDLDVTWLVFASFLEGICGTQSVITASVYSYIADVVSGPEHQKTFRFAVAHSLNFLGSAVGNLSVGVIIDQIGYLPLYWIFIILYVVDFLYIAILVPESNPRQEGTVFSIKGAFIKTAMFFKVYIKERPEHPTARISLGLLLAGIMITSIMTLGVLDVIVLYVTGEPFSLDSAEVGYFGALASTSGFLYAIFVVRILRKVGFADIGVSIISVIGAGIGFIHLGFAVGTLMLYFSKYNVITSHLVLKGILVRCPTLYSEANLQCAIRLYISDSC